MKRFLGAFLLLAAPVAAAGVAAPVEDGKIHACTGAGGNVVYLGEPCPDSVAYDSETSRRGPQASTTATN